MYCQYILHNGKGPYCSRQVQKDLLCVQHQKLNQSGCGKEIQFILFGDVMTGHNCWFYDDDGHHLDFVPNLMKIGEVIILRPNYVNFMRYKKNKTKRVSRNAIFVKKIKIICILYSCLKSDSLFDFKRLFDSFLKLSSTKFYKRVSRNTTLVKIQK